MVFVDSSVGSALSGREAQQQECEVVAWHLSWEAGKEECCCSVAQLSRSSL